MANPYALDFSPVVNALAGYQKAELDWAQQENANKRLAMEQERLGFERAYHPERLKGLQLGNTQTQQQIAREEKTLPLDLEGKRLSNAGHGLQNQNMAQNIQGKQLELEKELAGRAATIGQMIEAEPDPNKQSLMLNKFYNADPRIKQHLSKYLPPEVINDPIVASRYMRAVATGYQAPQTMKVGKDEALVGVSRDPNNPTAAPKVGQIFKNDGNDQFKDEHQLRGELSSNPTIKNFSEIKSGYGRMLEGQQAKTGAGDLAIVYGYMKMLDPTSVVREGEFATAEKTAGVPEQVRILYNKVLSGERLSDTVRQNFLGMSEGLYKRAEADVVKVQDQYRNLAQRYKLRPENVIIDQGIATAPAQQPNLPRFNPAPQGMRDIVPPAAQPPAPAMPQRQPGQQIPPGAIQALQADPSRAPEFDAKYGAGASRQFLMQR